MRVLAAVAAVLLLPAVASAQTTVNAPPGNSGISQYLEVVQGASGGKPSKDARKDDVKPPPALRRAGQDGQRLAAIAAGTSPAPTAQALGEHARSQQKGKAKRRGGTGQPQAVHAKKDDSSSKALAAAFTGSATGGSGGLGIPLIVPMLISAVVVGLAAWGARRRGTPEA